MEEKRFATHPLLYIQQPTIGKPKAQMQHNYYTPKKENINIEQTNQESKSSVKRPYQRNNYFEEESIFREMKKAEIKNEEEIENKIDIESDKVEKRFKHMTLQEKVNYFIEIPDHVVKVRCELRTEDERYQGIITDFKDNYVFIRIGRRSTSEKVLISDVLSIEILGF